MIASANFETVAFVECRSLIVFCINQQAIGRDVCAGLHTARDGTAYQEFPDSFALPVRPASQPPHANARHWIARQSGSIVSA